MAEEKEYVKLHVWGDESGINTEPTDMVPPDGRVLEIGIPNSDDLLMVVDRALLSDPEFVKEWFKPHLWDDVAEEA